ncbi:hypothetical protein [Azospirillum agricola]|uniref:hypothetical protein n=1 Tax=Azospirillum agricola TaxID=1720247 RepID=UPI000A0F1880|nr:hypothetical protein [Azospirillum agricola]SMH56714.1 hypothetical protein SAMN02982994_4145 [Azospirillum lipoferum]
MTTPVDTPPMGDAFVVSDAGREEAAHLPQIDHLSIAQLRQRAAGNRDDARRMKGRGFAGCVAMLLADAERCEARIRELEAMCGRIGSGSARRAIAAAARSIS